MGEPTDKIAGVLDTAEYLIRLTSRFGRSPGVQSDFRAHLAALVEKYPEMGLALRQFDLESIPDCW